MTVAQNVALDVVSGIITAIMLYLAGKAWGSLSFHDKRNQRKFLAQSQETHFVQKIQRDLFRYLGLAIYVAGAYIAFEIEFRYSPKAAIAFRFGIGVLILICGGLVMGNASVMNEYGVNKRIEAIEKLEKVRRERKEIEGD